MYGVLMIAAAERTFTHARSGRTERHRAWAIRLFALTVGSWLYRMEYGFWFLVMGSAGHTSDFRGGFDTIMMVFFYLPNLFIAELFIRARQRRSGPVEIAAATATLFAATMFVALATWVFAHDFWVPGMISGLFGPAG